MMTSIDQSELSRRSRIRDRGEEEAKSEQLNGKLKKGSEQMARDSVLWRLAAFMALL